MFRIIILIAIIMMIMPFLTKCKDDAKDGLKKAKAVGTIAEKALRYSQDGKDK